MKAMLLAAGRGERLRPLTDRVPKPLLNVGGETLIGRHLHRLATAGCRDVVINVHHLAHMIREALGDGGDYGLRIRYSVEDELLETGGGIRRALPMLGDEPFLVISADIYTDYDLSPLFGELPPESRGRLVMVPNPPHNPGGDFALDPDGALRLHGEGLTYSGVSVLSPGLFRDEPGRVFSLRKVWGKAVAAGRLQGEIYKGYWVDAGTPERYEQLLRDTR